MIGEADLRQALDALDLRLGEGSDGTSQGDADAIERYLRGLDLNTDELLAVVRDEVQDALPTVSGALHRKLTREVSALALVFLALGVELGRGNV